MAKTAKEIIDRYGKAKTGRLNWESYWQETAEYVMPNMSNTFFEGGYSLTQAEKKDRKRYDGSAEIALGRFAASMESMLTPRNSRWHALQSTDMALNKKPRVRSWFDNTTDALFKYRYDTAANFSSQNHEHFLSLGCFGTACLYIDKLRPRGLRYATVHIAQIYFYENHQGIIDEAIRGVIRLTAKQAVGKFGADKLPPDIKKAADDNDETMWDFIHCVYPNEERDVNRKDYRSMAFSSVYVAVKAQQIVLEEGFNTFPYCISRYMTAPSELYGRSPAMQALTNIKVLNEQKKTVLKQGHRVVDPVLLAHDDGVLDGFSLKAGAINTGAISADGKMLVQAMPTGNIAIGDKLMQIERDEISAAFLTDLFAILTERPQMTATEVIQLAQEKGILLSPTMGRQESEYLGPMIERELDLLMRQGLVDPMPEELLEAEGEYKVVFDSPLSRAQRSEQAAGLMRTVNWAAEMAGLTNDPSPLDQFNFDIIVPELAAIQAVPMRWMRTQEQVDGIRAGREQSLATQQVIEAGPTIAAMTKTK